MSASEWLSASAILFHPFSGHFAAGRSGRTREVLWFGCLMALAAWLCVSRATAECIDYGDFLHWAGSVNTPDWAYGVAVSGTHAYVTDHESGFHAMPMQCEPLPVLGKISGQM